MLLAGCSPAPDEAAVRAVVSDRLKTAFQDPLLEVSSLRRLGSAPLTAASDGAPRLIVYYNGEFVLDRDYRFSDWDALNPAALASLLGASDRGVTGIESAGNVAGDKLSVHGSVTFRQDADGAWAPMLFVPPEASAAVKQNEQASAPARELVEQIMARLAKIPPSQVALSRSIIAEEIQEAMHQIDLRLDNLQRILVVAGGPAEGEYALIAQMIAALGNSEGVKSAAVTTEGSAENAQLLRSHLANVGIVQSDVALMAFQGTGPFAGQGADPSLRALGSLFPEPVQIVVRADGPTSVEDLRGKRVDLDRLTSGARITGMQVLQAHGLSESGIQQSSKGLIEAANALVAGEIDAFVTVINSPERHLQRLAADQAIRILSLEPDVIQTLTKNYPGVVPITLAPGTYPGQDAPVHTIGVAALLLADDKMSNAEVRRVLQDVYSNIDFVAAGSMAGARISLRHAHAGVTVPMHAGAEAYFEDVEP